MRKIILIFLLLFILSAVYAGNNTTDIPNPTHHIENTETVIALESGDSNISFSDGYKGYCIEWCEHSATAGEKFYVHNNVDNNIKTFFVYFYKESQKDVIATQHMIWKFTDNKQFSRFNQTLYNQIIAKSSTTQVPNDGTLKIDNQTEMVFNFRNFIAQYEEYQNYFAYKIYFRNITYENDTQINESTINNYTNTTQQIQNNITNTQVNKTIIKKQNKNIILPTSKKINLKKHICGKYPEWIWGWIVLLSIIYLLLYKKEK